MDLGLKFLPNEVNEWAVTREIAKILHSDEFLPRRPDERLINFCVKLNPSPAGGVRNDGTGVLTLPDSRIGNMLLKYLTDHPLKIEKKKIKVYRIYRPPPEYLTARLGKTPYISPDIEEERQEKLWQLDEKLRVDLVQFGVFYREKYPQSQQEPLQPRAFSIEWERCYSVNSAAWISFEYDHKLIRLELGNSMTDTTGQTVAIRFATIQKIAVGYDGKPYVCFDTVTPPIMEQGEFHRMFTGDNLVDNNSFRLRIGSLDPLHSVVAPYAPHLRIVLYHDPRNDVIEKFISMCRVSGLEEHTIFRCPSRQPIEAHRACFFTGNQLYQTHRELAKFSWSVAFQMESFLHNGVLNTEELWTFIPSIRKLCRERSSDYVGDLLRCYHEALQVRSPRESPANCFMRIQTTFTWLRFREFRCCHVTFTPTRMLLEGPYSTDSNRVIRDYKGYEDHFIRVDFRDEDRLQYRWDKHVDGASFIKERVGNILKHGFELAGRKFEFLAYSNSALREHAVWFMNPFEHPTRGWVTSENIRNNLGNFEKLLKYPSKFAARIAQAFTATKPSVIIRRNEWQEMPDLGPPKERCPFMCIPVPEDMPKEDKPEHLFTDGVGTISKSLGDRIWAKLCESRRDNGVNSIPPSAYQIRFLGYKGVVVIDEELDKRTDGIHMRLRPSMRKFDSHADEAEIEIALSFESPGMCYLNRPLVMLLEDLGVRREAFQELQEAAVAEARTIDDSVFQFRKVLEAHGLGNPFRISHLLRKIEALGLTLAGTTVKPGFDTPFFKQLRQVAMTSILREIKHNARIPIPDSYLLVGVADEGPSYIHQGRDDVYFLKQAEIYVCIQGPNDPEPTYLEGSCSISRSPVNHPGDVKRVRAIGKPPTDKLCLFSHLKNVVVLPSVGVRSLASCLSGGDLDGDLYSVIHYGPLLQKEDEDAASYESQGTLEIDRNSTVDDICDFIVEYINSDVLGLLSTRLLIIADQSSEGMLDEGCKWLAELCSQAVDYPKQGIPVDLDNNRLPSTLIRCKPDWQAAEIVSPRHTDYYESTRALGYLYRAITLKEPDDIPMRAMVADGSDPLSLALLDRILFYLEDVIYPGASGMSVETSELFQKYSDELSYICATHTLSNTPGVRLMEAEVVMGTILAKASQRRWRSDRMYRMRLHALSLVKEVQRELLKEDETPSPEELVAALQRGWMAWCFSQKHGNEFGANSFGLIALGVIFDCLDRL